MHCTARVFQSRAVPVSRQHRSRLPDRANSPGHRWTGVSMIDEATGAAEWSERAHGASLDSCSISSSAGLSARVSSSGW